MPKQLYYKSLFLLLLGAFYSCGSEEKVEEPIVTENVFSESTDSLFGNLSEQQLYWQHLVLTVPQSMQGNIDSLQRFIAANEPGALRLVKWNIDSIEILKSQIDTLDIIQPVFMCDYFKLIGAEPYPFWKTSDSLKNSFYTEFYMKSNMNFIDFGSGSNFENTSFFDSIASQKSLVPILSNYSDKNVKTEYEDFMKSITSNSNGVLLDIATYDTLNFEQIKKSQNFKGYLFVRPEDVKTNNLLMNGVDFVFADETYQSGLNDWNQENKTEEFINSTKRILAFKENLKGEGRVNFQSELDFLRLNYQLKSTALISDKRDLVPFKNRFTIYSTEKLRIRQKIRDESNCRTEVYKQKNLAKVIAADGNKVLILPDSISKEDAGLLQKIKKENHLIVCFRNVFQYNELKNLPHLLYLPKTELLDAEILAQQIKGKLSIEANFIAGQDIIKGKVREKSGLSRAKPELVGMSSDTIRQIDYAIKTAMNGRSFPGCQVLLAKNGTIIYDKCFGHHSYKREKLVTPESMYDLASLTKVVATTMIGMKLYEMNAYNLEDSLVDYLPDSLKLHLKYPSTIRNITFQELFIHKSGLPSGFPIINYMQYTSSTVGRYDMYYCDWEDSTFTIEVAENYYMDKAYADSMWLRLNSIFLDPAKPYKYSDVSMNTLYYMFSGLLRKNPKEFGFNQTKEQLAELNLFEEYLYTNFYTPLGMSRTRYRPKRLFNKNEIVPTEDEKYWRKQLLQGHVHDPNAALMGGVAGNAGMFSTTNDLVKLMQMLLNKGIFEGKRYLNAETVTKFTSAQVGSHRGLGWNKPTITSKGYGISDFATLQTFGHTGFTGTCLWVDPASEIVYIFLSNRVHPTVNNRIYQYGIRKTVHQMAYRSLIHETHSRN